jgi:hypothetical protein
MCVSPLFCFLRVDYAYKCTRKNVLAICSLQLHLLYYLRYTYMYVCMHVDMYIYVYVCSAAVEVVCYLRYINVCMYVSICTYIYIHIHIYRHSVAVGVVNKLLQLL